MVRVSEEAGEAVEGVVAKLAKDAFETTGKDVGKDATKSGGKRAAKSGGKRAAKKASRKNMGFTPADRERIFQKNLEKNGGVHKCDYCGKQVYRRKSKSGIPGQHDDAQIDHEFPKSRGGEGAEHNAHVTCRRCNRHKSTRSLPEWDDELREWLE